ncbi:hypothetical protein [Hominenteromicrobium sp.]|uniref:hypothetical protein n=1 Tax=Hominenteromicrobium sp. TaxID=3073581 RepID=UPI003AF19CAB
MAEYIERRTAISKLTALEVIEPRATMTDAKRVLADMPAAKAVSLHDIYRVIAGHSYYHGDRILAALSCIAEGKEVHPVRPADVAPVVRCKDCKHLVAVNVNGKGIPTCRASGMEVAPDEFCSRGEKGRRCGL